MRQKRKSLIVIQLLLVLSMIHLLKITSVKCQSSFLRTGTYKYYQDSLNSMNLTILYDQPIQGINLSPPALAYGSFNALSFIGQNRSLPNINQSPEILETIYSQNYSFILIVEDWTSKGFSLLIGHNENILISNLIQIKYFSIDKIFVQLGQIITVSFLALNQTHFQPFKQRAFQLNFTETGGLSLLKEQNQTYGIAIFLNSFDITCRSICGVHLRAEIVNQSFYKINVSANNQLGLVRSFSYSRIIFNKFKQTQSQTFRFEAYQMIDFGSQEQQDVVQGQSFFGVYSFAISLFETQKNQGANCGITRFFYQIKHRKQDQIVILIEQKQDDTIQVSKQKVEQPQFRQTQQKKPQSYRIQNYYVSEAYSSLTTVCLFLMLLIIIFLGLLILRKVNKLIQKDDILKQPQKQMQAKQQKVIMIEDIGIQCQINQQRQNNSFFKNQITSTLQEFYDPTKKQKVDERAKNDLRFSQQFCVKIEPQVHKIVIDNSDFGIQCDRYSQNNYLEGQKYQIKIISENKLNLADQAIENNQQNKKQDISIIELQLQSKVQLKLPNQVNDLSVSHDSSFQSVEQSINKSRFFAAEISQQQINQLKQNQQVSRQLQVEILNFAKDGNEIGSVIQLSNNFELEDLRYLFEQSNMKANSCAQEYQKEQINQSIRFDQSVQRYKNKNSFRQSNQKTERNSNQVSQMLKDTIEYLSKKIQVLEKQKFGLATKIRQLEQQAQQGKFQKVSELVKDEQNELKYTKERKRKQELQNENQQLKKQMQIRQYQYKNGLEQCQKEIEQLKQNISKYVHMILIKNSQFQILKYQKQKIESDNENKINSLTQQLDSFRERQILLEDKINELQEALEISILSQEKSHCTQQRQSFFRENTQNTIENISPNQRERVSMAIGKFNFLKDQLQKISQCLKNNRPLKQNSFGTLFETIQNLENQFNQKIKKNNFSTFPSEKLRQNYLQIAKINMRQWELLIQSEKKRYQIFNKNGQLRYMIKTYLPTKKAYYKMLGDQSDGKLFGDYSLNM